MEFTYENEEGEEIVVEFPSKKVVCSECNGHGTHLAPGLKGEAFTAEEFYEAFDDEESREEYFKPGGIYDVTCSVCHGKNVVDEIDEEQCKQNPELAVHFAAWQQKLEDDYQYRQECEAERRIGC